MAVKSARPGRSSASKGPRSPRRPRPPKEPKHPKEPKAPKTPRSAGKKAKDKFRFRPPKKWWADTPKGAAFSVALSNRLRHLYAARRRIEDEMGKYRAAVKLAVGELQKTRTSEKGRILKLEQEIGEAQAMLLTAQASAKWCERKLLETIKECDQATFADVDPAPTPYTESNVVDEEAEPEGPFGFAAGTQAAQTAQASKEPAAV